MPEAADDAADPDESVEVGGEFVAVDVAGVACRVGEGHAVLVEIVGDRELAAEGVPAALDVDLVDLVIARLKQDRHVEPRLVDEFGDRDLVAEIRQADHQPVDRIALLAKKRRVAARVLARLHRAVLRRIDRQDAVGDIEPVELSEQLLARLKGRRPLKNSRLPTTSPSLMGRRLRLLMVGEPCVCEAARPRSRPTLPACLVLSIASISFI